MPKAIKTGLIAFAFLSYLILIGVPGRIGQNALPILAAVAAIFFWFKLRREIGSLPRSRYQGAASPSDKPGWEIGQPGETQTARREERTAAYAGGVGHSLLTPPSSVLIRSGLLAGAVTGLLLAIVSGIFATLLGNGIAVQPVFDKMVPLNVAALLGVQPGAIAQAQVSPLRYLLQVAYFTAGGLVSALIVTAVQTARKEGRGGRNERTAISAYARVLSLLTPHSSLLIPRWVGIGLPFVLLAFVIYLGLPNVRLFGSNHGTVRLLLTLATTGSGLFALRLTQSGRERSVVTTLLGLGALSLPFVLDQFQNSVMGIVFIFVMLGLGLNIVVGYAGLLDLGYVAFFAIGAYTYALVSAPFSSPVISALLLNLGFPPDSPLLGYWMALPLAMITAAVGGILLGIPVLRLRGDYLAIVTLGFGEIIRLFMLNLGDLTNGPRGILKIAQPRLFGLTPEALTGGRLSSQGWIFLLALISSALIAFIAIRLNDSRLGRAWTAMQEDEDVAQATGVHLVRTKLLAFAIGATFAGLAGQLYAARQINIFPENFSLFVSIDALALIIVGGIGSPAGIVLGALALKGLPEVLRGVDEYRIVTFAALLVIMMIVRPAGILPSARRGVEMRLPQETPEGEERGTRSEAGE